MAGGKGPERMNDVLSAQAWALSQGGGDDAPAEGVARVRALLQPLGLQPLSDGGAGEAAQPSSRARPVPLLQ